MTFHIDIIIPSYKCADTLDRTLSSLEAQTDSDFGVIIVDDCSPDNIDEIVSRHPRLNITLLHNSSNIGCGMSRQVGIDYSQADYFALLDADDMLMPYTVETWKNSVIGNPDVDILHAWFYEQTIVNDEPALLLKKTGFTWVHGKLYKASFIRENNIRNSPEVIWADDSYFNSMCTELGKVMIVPIPLHIWVNNKNSITRSNKEFVDGRIYDFIHAMRLSVQFIRSHGIDVKDIGFISQTIDWIKSQLDKTNEKAKTEFNLFISEIGR